MCNQAVKRSGTEIETEPKEERKRKTSGGEKGAGPQKERGSGSLSATGKDNGTSPAPLPQATTAPCAPSVTLLFSLRSSSRLAPLSVPFLFRSRSSFTSVAISLPLVFRSRSSGLSRSSRPRKVPGYSIRLLPFLALAALAFGVMYVYIGVTTILLGAWAWGAIICGFGLIGILLALGFWRARQRLAKREAELNRRA